MFLSYNFNFVMYDRINTEQINRPLTLKVKENLHVFGSLSPLTH